MLWHIKELITILHSNTIIIICGPTAVGKTAFSIQLAKALQTEIISADSRQCYEEVNIGVAKPSHKELAEVRHWFINSHSIHSEVNAGLFEQYALEAAANIFRNHTAAVMVGGTGLYIKAFCEGMDDVAAVDPAIRQKMIADYNEKGLEFLQKQLAEKDPDFWQIAEQQNPQRLMRALEVFLSTGRSVLTFRTGSKKLRPFNIIKIGLELPRPLLNEQINCRVDKMMEDGLLAEAIRLYNYKYLNALQTVGYRELFDFIENKFSLNEAVEKIKINTRQYAKRQMTWFKKDTMIKWYNSYHVSVKEVLSLIK
ncbi:MAG TPA: tRNA (adenosine(37)-N6)-dimethylallyltransferase MiaA [Segetibacter sp.]|nr:tRNA (adenosine(37)-N6)-dimethylallyltransferase MiaA [Segetibacter sp.]